MDWTKELNTAIEAATACGAYLHSARYSFTIVDDSGRDFKIDADIESEEIAKKILSATHDHPIIAEETATSQDFRNTNRPFWIIDPLDGTLNFGRDIPYSCVSISLWNGDNPLLGVVYDFNRDEMFHGIVGSGAYRGGSPIHVTSATEPSKSMIATGFPVHSRFDKQDLLVTLEHIQNFKKVRMLGSAALSLAYVACGRVDAYAEKGIMLWDVAAGVALVRAAGGHVDITQSSEDVLWSYNIQASGSPNLWTP